MATGSEISEIISPAERAGLRPPPYSQYSRPDEVALFVGDVAGVAERFISGAPVVGGRLCERIDDLELLEHRSRPAVGDDHRLKAAERLLATLG